jgi:ubiquitin C-terminal hydrolase
MNENNISIKNDFFEFTEELFQQIEETEISLDNEICYLIKESWIKKFINDKNKIDIKFPQFLYDFKDIISCIRDNQKFNFVKKQFINNYYSEKELKNTKFIKYYTGNNNIIIEFEKNKEKRALMIRNFTKEENKIENKSFIILLEDRYLNEKNKLKLFRKLLSSNKSDNNIIIPYRAYIILLNEFEEKYEKKINIYKYNNEKYIEANEIVNNKNEELKNILLNKEKEIDDLINEINSIKKASAIENNQININNIYYKKNIKEEDEIKKLNKREKLIKEKEKEINNKIMFLENKEEELEKMFKENNKIVDMNIYLNQKNQQLENEIKQNEIKLNEILSKINKYNKEPEPIDSYKNPTLIGLNNIGATCFMNATLQCLSQTRNLTNYFLKKDNQKKIYEKQNQNQNELQLCPVYLELIQNLWDKNNMNKSYSPNKFMNVIEEMNPLFKKGQAGDSKDFIIFILEQLHRELKKQVANIIVNEPLNQYDKNNAFNSFFSEFSKECSILSDLFFGFNETTNICLNCKNFYESKGLSFPICYNYGIFNCLIFPLEEVKNMKNNALKDNNILINANNNVTIYECFYYNQKSDLFTGENKNYCNICRQLWDSVYTSKIFVTPNILIIILNRGKGNIYKVKLDFNEVIDITQFVIQKDKPQLIYSLYGVITHIGESGPNAHFIASCKSPIDNQWYRYNDAMVNPINNVQKDIIDFGTPYILFYSKNK